MTHDTIIKYISIYYTYNSGYYGVYTIYYYMYCIMVDILGNQWASGYQGLEVELWPRYFRLHAPLCLTRPQLHCNNLINLQSCICTKKKIDLHSIDILF